MLSGRNLPPPLIKPGGLRATVALSYDSSMSSTPPRDNADQAAFDAALTRACAAIGLGIEPAQRAAMYAHFARVVQANRRFNLTRITDPAEAAVKHYADSLTLLAAPWIDRPRPLTLLDVGTGAGFPAVPLAILCPHWRITAIDGTGKKAQFVAETAAELGLTNLAVRHARGMDFARQCPGAFDLVVLRAVGKIARGLKELHPLVRPGGSMVFYKTARIAADELREASAMVGRLGLVACEPFTLTMPAPEGVLTRQLLRYHLPS